MRKTWKNRWQASRFAQRAIYQLAYLISMQHQNLKMRTLKKKNNFQFFLT